MEGSNGPWGRLGRRMIAVATAILTLATGLVATAVVPGTAYADEAAADAGIDAKPLIHYSFDNAPDGTTIANEGTAPNGDGTLNANATVTAGSINLTGTQTIDVPTAAIQGRKDLTVSIWLRNDFGNGNTAAAYIGNADTRNGYWLLNPANPQGYFKSAVTNATAAAPNNTPYSTEVGPGRTPAPTTSVKATPAMALYTTVFDGNNGTLTVYRDGQRVGDQATIPAGGLANYGDLVAYIGKSAYGVDPYDKITVDDYAVYGEALSGRDVQALFAAQATPARAKDALTVPAGATADFTVPATSAGAKVTWSSNNAAIAIDGETARVTRPEAGQDNVTVTLTADLAYPDGTKDKRTFTVTVYAQAKGPIAADAYKPEVKENDKAVTFEDPTDGNKQKTITIKHPGLFTNKAYLDAMRDGVRNGDELWVQAYNSFAGYEFARRNARVFYSTCFQNVPGPWSSGAALCGLKEFSEVTKRLQWDGDTALRQAMMWYITGDNDYRARALYIVRSYANVKSTAGGYDFRSGPGAFGITVAAEILRATDPNPNQVPTVNPEQDLEWSDEDTAKLSRALDIYARLFTAEDWRRYMNQDMFCNAGRLAKAIWQDDGAAYADVVQRVVRGDDNSWQNGSIHNFMHWMTENEVTGEPIAEDQQHAQLMEMGRDAGHAQVDMGGLSTLVQSLYVQGTTVDPATGVISDAADAINPFDYEDDRLMHGMAYFLKYHLGIAVPWTTMKADGGYWISRNNFGDNNVTPYLGIVYNYYKYVKKADMAKGDLAIIAYAMETHFPEDTQRGASGRNFPGSGNLLATPTAAFGAGSPRNTFTGTPALTATSTGADSVKLTWGGVTGTTQSPRYVVLMTQDGPDAASRNWQIVNNPELLVDSYEAKNLNTNKQYYWKVRIAGTWTESNEATIAPADMGKGGATAAAPKANADGLVLRYSFDDLTSTANGSVVKDDSGNGHDGTIVTAKTGRVETADAANAKLGKAITLDGDNGNDPSYIDMPGDIANKLDEMTVSAWVKLPSDGKDGYRTGTSTSLFSFTSGDGVNSPANVGQAGEYVEMEPARIKLLNRNDALGTREQSFAINDKVGADQWANLTVTIAKDGTTYVYLNGTPVTTPNDALGAALKDADGNAITADHVTFKGTQRDMFQAVNAWIGRSAFGNGYLRGSVDDFRIYNKALAADQVKNIVDGTDLSSDATLTKLTFNGADVNLTDAITTNGAVVNVDDLSKVVASDAATTPANAGDTVAYALKGNLLTVEVASKDGKARRTYTIRLVDGSATAGPVLEYTFDTDTAAGAGMRVANTGSTGSALDGVVANNGGAIAQGAAAGGAAAANRTLKLNGGNHGAGATVTIPSGLIADGQQDLTVSMDYLWDGNGSCVYPWALGKGTADYLVNNVNCGGNTRVEVSKNSGYVRLTGTTPVRKTWHTVTVVLKGGASIAYYLDGALVKSAATTLTAADFAGTGVASGYLGLSFYGNDKDFGGQLDNVRVWRRALADNELPKASDTIAVTGLTVDAKPTKTEYAVGDKLDTAGLKASVTYSNGDTQTLDGNDFTFTGFDSGADATATLPAKQTVTAALKADPTRTFTFDVTFTTRPATAVTITGTAATTVGGTAKLEATIAPADTDTTGVTWASSDANIATVAADGTVTGKAVGEVTITATAKDGHAVKGTTVFEVVPDHLVYYIDAGTGANGNATVASPAYDAVSAHAKAAGQALSNDTSDQLSADANTWGLVEADASRRTDGTVGNSGWYRAATGDTLSYRLPLKAGTYTVTSQHVRWWAIDRTFKPSVSWTDASGKVQTMDGEQVTLDGGHLNATGTVTFTLDKDATVTYTLTKVTDANVPTATQGPQLSQLSVTKVVPVAVTGVTARVDRTALTVGGGTAQATAEVAPANASDRTVTWKSSNEKVATMDADTGVITAVASGKADITATAGGKTSAPVTVTVTTPVAAITAAIDKATLSVGGTGAGNAGVGGAAPATAQATATVTPANADDKAIVWSTSNRHIATVDAATGKVTAVAPGKASIIATAKDGSGVFGSADVTVEMATSTDPVLEYTFDNAGDSADAGRTVANTGAAGQTLDGAIANTGATLAAHTANGKALKLNGGNHGAGAHLTIPAGLIANGQQDLTVSADYLWDGNGTCVYPFALGSGTTDYLVNIVNCGGNTRVEAVKGSAKVQLAGTTPAKDTWVTVAAVVTGGKSIAYYVDGALVATQATTLTAANFAGNGVASGYLGLSFYGTDKDFGGQLDNVRVWNRALAETELPKAATIASIAVSKQPSKVEYVAGESFDAAGLEVTATMSDGTKRVLGAADYEVSGFDPAKVGKQTLTVTVPASAATGDKALTATFAVSVKAKVIPVASVTVALDKATLTVGDAASATATVLPEDATNKAVSWSSSNTAVATVDAASGKVTAVAPGTADIVATAKDGSGKSGKAALTVREKPDTAAPVFAGVADVAVDFGGAFDAMAGVSAKDDRDGDVTGSIKVSGTVDTSKAGTYTLTYTVADKAGNTATATRKVTVKPQPDTVKPVFAGVVDVTVDFGASFDPLAGVTAKDDRDGDLTGSVKVAGSVDTSKAGTYELTYTVADKAGNTATVTRKVTVKAQPDTVKPVISGVTDVAVDFGAKFEPLAGVSASDDRDGDVTAAIKVTGSVDTSKAGTYTLTYTVADKAGNTATATRRVTVKPQPVPECVPARFTDLAGASHVGDIEWLSCQKITEGFPNGDGTVSFGGMRTVVRQDMAAFLWRMAGEPEFDVDAELAKRQFTDVDERTPHYKAILWLAKAGISTGYANGDGTRSFGGMRTVVRQDMAAFLHRYAQWRGAAEPSGQAVAFTDVDGDTSHREDIDWLSRTGVTTGYDNGDGTVSFGGMRDVVRQDMAAFLHRMSTNVLK